MDHLPPPEEAYPTNEIFVGELEKIRAGVEALTKEVQKLAKEINDR